MDHRTIPSNSTFAFGRIENSNAGHGFIYGSINRGCCCFVNISFGEVEMEKKYSKEDHPSGLRSIIFMINLLGAEMNDFFLSFITSPCSSSRSLSPSSKLSDDGTNYQV